MNEIDGQYTLKVCYSDHGLNNKLLAQNSGDGLNNKLLAGS